MTEPDTELPFPYCHRIERPAPHRPEGTFMVTYGTHSEPPVPMRTVHDAALTEIARTRILHTDNGPLTCWIWPHRGEYEHYRTPPPTDAYRLDVGGVDGTDSVELPAEVQPTEAKATATPPRYRVHLIFQTRQLVSPRSYRVEVPAFTFEEAWAAGVRCLRQHAVVNGWTGLEVLSYTTCERIPDPAADPARTYTADVPRRADGWH